jgi:hypothetical protein
MWFQIIAINIGKIQIDQTRLVYDLFLTKIQIIFLSRKKFYQVLCIIKCIIFRL